jgi:hypothetical protein
MASRVLLAVALSSFFLAASGCRVFDESFLDPPDAGLPDAGPGEDGGPDAGPPGDAGCTPRHPPERPAPFDAGVPDDQELAFALRDLVLDQRGAAWLDIGYDLDGKCSYPPPPATDAGPGVDAGEPDAGRGAGWMIECVPPNVGSAPETDGNEGIDNSYGSNFSLLILAFVSELREQLDAEHAEGRGVVLLRLREWNGQDDDARVEVAIASGVRTEPASSGVDGGMGDGGVDAGTAPPRWDGTDTFVPSADDFVPGDPPRRPNIVNDNAYVAGRTLVVQLPDRSRFVWAGEGLSLTLALVDPLLTGRISDDGLRLQGVTLAGRWARLDLLDGLEGVGFCAGSENRTALEMLFDTAADLREDPAAAGPGTVCNAVSTAIEMTGYGGQWGPLAAPGPLPSACP